MNCQPGSVRLRRTDRQLLKLRLRSEYTSGSMAMLCLLEHRGPCLKFQCYHSPSKLNTKLGEFRPDLLAQSKRTLSRTGIKIQGLEVVAG